MEFTTPVSIKSEEPKIDYSSKILLLGSCFAENITKKLDYYKLRNLSNPFGILYHPAAIEKLILNSLRDFEYSEKDVFLHNERWHCFDAHSRLSNPVKEKLINQLNLALRNIREYLLGASHLIITLGTSRVYKLKENEKTVANCHKIPQNEFSRELLSVAEIKSSLLNIISEVKKLNPSINVIFNVSPVRHIKDGLIENNISKAHLLAALNEATGQERVSYFPSYEILTDELRDYRFYADDLIHPSNLAIEYIWERFVKAWFSSEAAGLLQEVESIQKALSHKPFNKNSEAYKKFVNTLRNKIISLKQKVSYFDF